MVVWSYITYAPALHRSPESGISGYSVVFAEATVLYCIRTVPELDVCLKDIVPAVPVLTTYKPRKRQLPLNTGAAIFAPDPTSTSPLVAALEATWDTVAK